MAITREPLTPTLIDNTTMQKVFRDGRHVQYDITPSEGYVLHDKAYDAPELDEYGEETGGVILGYRISTASCSASYDFEANPREFYAVPESDVPADRVLDVTRPEHETM